MCGNSGSVVAQSFLIPDPMKFSAIADKIGITQASSLNSQPDHDPEITGVAPVDEATAGTLSYIEGPKFAALCSNYQRQRPDSARG